MSTTTTANTSVIADTDADAVSAIDVDTVSKAARIAAIFKAGGAVLMIGLLFPEWIKGGANGLGASGGGGFGLLALTTAVVALASAGRTLSNTERESKVFGLNQLSGSLALATFLANLVYLWVFTTGGAPKWIYVASNVILYASIVGLFARGSARAKPLPASTARAIGLVTLILGLIVAAAPTLEYTKLSQSSFTGLEPGAPRIGILFLILGGAAVLFGANRVFTPDALSELGPYVLFPHVTIGLGIVCFAPALAWMVTGLWGSLFSAPGIGVYVNVAAGAALIAVGIAEARLRSAPGI